MEPVRIDIVTSVSGTETCVRVGSTLIVDFDGESAPVLSREDSLLSTKAAGRQRDRKHRRSFTTVR
jgi:hypothetical protein